MNQGNPPSALEPTTAEMANARAVLAQGIDDADRLSVQLGMPTGMTHPSTLSFGTLSAQVSGLVNHLGAYADAGQPIPPSVAVLVREMVATVRAYDERAAASRAEREALAPVVEFPVLLAKAEAA